MMPSRDEEYNTNFGPLVVLQASTGGVLIVVRTQRDLIEKVPPGVPKSPGRTGRAHMMESIRSTV